MYTLADDIVNVETCRDNNEFKLISRTCSVIDPTMIINESMDYSSAQLNIKTLLTVPVLGPIYIIILITVIHN
jgi:hypothetical protein